jgi:hypothetical protein
LEVSKSILYKEEKEKRTKSLFIRVGSRSDAVVVADAESVAVAVVESVTEADIVLPGLRDYPVAILTP